MNPAMIFFSKGVPLYRRLSWDLLSETIRCDTTRVRKEFCRSTWNKIDPYNTNFLERNQLRDSSLIMEKGPIFKTDRHFSTDSKLVR